MSEREWRFYLDDMHEFAEKVVAYSEDMNQADFESNNLNFDAIVRNIELIGEAATHIPEQIRTANPNFSNYKRLNKTQTLHTATQATR